MPGKDRHAYEPVVGVDDGASDEDVGVNVDTRFLLATMAWGRARGDDALCWMGTAGDDRPDPGWKKKVLQIKLSIRFFQWNECKMILNKALTPNFLTALSMTPAPPLIDMVFPTRSAVHPPPIIDIVSPTCSAVLSLNAITFFLTGLSMAPRPPPHNLNRFPLLSCSPIFKCNNPNPNEFFEAQLKVTTGFMSHHCSRVYRQVNQSNHHQKI